MVLDSQPVRSLRTRGREERADVEMKCVWAGTERDVDQKEVPAPKTTSGR